MEGLNNIACPVCTLYLRPGMTLESHLTSHPKQKVIEALIRVTHLGPDNVEKVANVPMTECHQPMTPGMQHQPMTPGMQHQPMTPGVQHQPMTPGMQHQPMTPGVQHQPMTPGMQQTTGIGMLPQMNMNSNMNQIPANHSFVYQQFMSTSGTQPVLNMNPMNQQFVAIPAVFNPQMMMPQYVFQQQQQMQIVAAGGNIPGNIQPCIPRSPIDFSNLNSAMCAVSNSPMQDPLSTMVNTTISTPKLSEISMNSSPEISSVSDKITKIRNSLESNIISVETIARMDKTPNINIDKSFTIQRTLESTNANLANITNLDDPLTSIDLTEEDEKKDNKDICSSSDPDPNIISEEPDDEVASNTIEENNAEDDEKKEEENIDENDLNKACQTTQTLTDEKDEEKDEMFNSEPTENDNDRELTDEKDEEKDEMFNSEPIENDNDRELIIGSAPHEFFDQNQMDHITSNNDYERDQRNIECSSLTDLQNDPNITVLEMDDMNFILPNDFMQSEHSIISKENEIECNTNTDNRKEILMNIEEQDDNIIVGAPDYEDDNIMDEKYDEECASRESLNIRADERMPPRGELSEQESNGASEVGWGSRMYQEGSSGMSTSYDLLARESWEASDCSDSEMPPLQSRIQPSIDYNAEDVDEPDPLPDEKLEGKDDGSSSSFHFSCSICEQTFRCPKERRVHQTQEHASSSSGIIMQTPKNELSEIKANLSQEEEEEEEGDSKLDVFMDTDDMTPEEKFETKPETKPKVEETDTKEHFLCNTCGELVPSLRLFNIHNKKVHNIQLPNQNLTCKTCNEPFRKQLDFIEHLKQHPLECSICGKHFFKPNNFKMHLKRHSGFRPHKCEICNKSFFAKQKLREHLNIHTGNNPIKCTMCDESFKRYSNLVQHRNHHHLKIKKKTREYMCHCGQICNSKSKFDWHKETHESKPKSCMYCNEKFIHMASLTRHIRRSHNQHYVPDDNRKDENVECKICKGIYLKSSIEAHMSIHSGKRLHSCPICNKEFTTKWNLKLHKWIHAAPSNKPYKCDICQSAYFRESDYISHMNSHRSVKPYTCNYCGCKFIRKYNCVRHVKEHEAGKSYNCDVCNKSFHRSYYLKEHMRVHTGARPFSCNICGKTSTTKSNHNKHMKIHHAREPVTTEG